MSISSIPPLPPVAPAIAPEQASVVTLNPNAVEQASAVNTTETGDSIVELSTLALQQNTQQLSVQKQIITLNSTQENALKHLESLAASTNANTSNNRSVIDQRTPATFDTTEALLNAELKSTLNNEAFIDAINTESHASVLNEVNTNAITTPNTVVTSPSITQSISATTGNIINPTNTAAQSVQIYTTHITISPPVDHAAIATINSMDYATETGSNPAVAAAIAAYQLSNGILKDEVDKTPGKFKSDEVSVKGVTLLDATERINDNDAEQKAKREIPWIWKRVLRIKKKFMKA
ncbi:hypothetical protein H8K32_00340 [Undibacterium jejuense]|uniref:Uncharacterized protein n=1 Tax=Undibacterium jejuense TaxID=1344949 RepID=A0A923KJF4_9BURK|nr:hypothetical protein [Undibacterium jejuense]MBC3860535.1 hypothetical protein [Undibacterium jejuense]